MRSPVLIEAIDAKNAGIDPELDKKGNGAGRDAFNVRRAGGPGQLVAEDTNGRAQPACMESRQQSDRPRPKNEDRRLCYDRHRLRRIDRRKARVGNVIEGDKEPFVGNRVRQKID